MRINVKRRLFICGDNRQVSGGDLRALRREARVFIDPAGYKEYVGDARQTFQQALQEQKVAAAH
jgi:hypothetical protein